MVIKYIRMLKKSVSEHHEYDKVGVQPLRNVGLFIVLFFKKREIIS